MQPLEGIRVVDFTQALAGPFAGMLMADMGADVIKVEPLTGDHIRAQGTAFFYLMANRNKRGLAMDIRSDEGRRIVRRLVKEVDVLLEAFVPGVMDRLGLGYQALSEINPGLVYCSISGYGQNGPYRTRRGYDACAQAESGLMEATGLDDGPPIRTGSAFIDYSTGMFAAMGAAFALLGREKTGRGQHIDVSLLDSALSHMSHWITRYSETGLNPPRSMSETVPVAPYDMFPTKDKKIFIGTLKENHWQHLCTALGLEELVDDPRFVSNEKRASNRRDMLFLLSEKTREFACDDLQEQLAGAGIPCAPVNNISQVMEDSHVKARETIFSREYPGKGTIQYMRNPIRMSETDYEFRSNAPLLGEHTAEILREIGCKEEEINELAALKVIAVADEKSAGNE